MEPAAADPTPESAYRGWWFSSVTWLIVFVPLSVFSTWLRSQGDPGAAGIVLWTTIGTISVFGALLLVIALPIDRLQRRLRKENPTALVFVARKTKFYDQAIDKLTENHFNLTYLSVVVADAAELRIFSRRGTTFTIPWTRVIKVVATSTRDSRIDYPAVGIDIQFGDERVRIPLDASTSGWTFPPMTRPHVIRGFTRRLQDLADHSIR